jgi:hypothetical protein
LKRGEKEKEFPLKRGEKEKEFPLKRGEKEKEVVRLLLIFGRGLWFARGLVAGRRCL